MQETRDPDEGDARPRGTDQAECGGARGCALSVRTRGGAALMKKNRYRALSRSTAGGTPEGWAGSAAGFPLGRQNGQSPWARVPPESSGVCVVAETGDEAFLMPKAVQISSHGEDEPVHTAIARTATGASTLARRANIAIQLTMRRRRTEVMTLRC